MENKIIDEQTKTFLIACLVTGIDVTCDQRDFMVGLVDHMNSTERVYWTTGDEDGVIIHDNLDQPLLYIIFTGKRLVFRTLGENEFSALETKENTAFALLNIIDYIRSLDLQFCPSILGSEAPSTSETMDTSDDTSDTNPEDWSM